MADLAGGRLHGTHHDLHNDHLVCHLVVEEQVRLTTLTDVQRDRTLVKVSVPLIEIEVAGQAIEPTTVETADATTLQVLWSRTEPPFNAELRLHLDGPSLHSTLQVWGADVGLRFRFPFLAHLCATDEPDAIELLDAGTLRMPEGETIFRHSDWPLPKVWLGAGGAAVTLLGGVTDPDAVQAVDMWAEDGVAAVAEREIHMVWQAELNVHAGGWPAAWDLFRQRVRRDFDLQQYERPELAWYGDQLVHHFTFLYGREILNLETEKFEIDRFLDEGERLFGGYDGMLIWGVYPRIGVDERTQWDFHDDLPDGRAGLRTMARRARERGTRFFVPYKPWDRSADLHGVAAAAPDHEELARLVVDTEADGVFLDTMSAISPEFRSALDDARPGTVFCSEGRAKGKAFELITGSWDQSPTRDTLQGNWSAAPEVMPGVDVWRFVFPEHRLFVIDRHAMGTDRRHVIQRGFFGGTGWVVWQDIFGLVLPYTPDEAALLKHCRTILREQREALWTATPTPLIATSHPQVYCNEFAGERKRLWTFYNATGAPVEVRLPSLVPRASTHFIDLWNDEEASTDEQGLPCIRLAAHAVGALGELPCLLGVSADHGDVRVRDEVPGAWLEMRQAGHATSVQISGREQVELATLRASRQEVAVVRLMLNGELLDQIVLPASAIDERT